ncbi:probable 1,3-beta-glucan synthase component FKS3 [Zygosaccharomyces bailii]|nr:probable 1,3-beta-glucan synthase component FKS3 [Zygosaccharomyces bailii]
MDDCSPISLTDIDYPAWCQDEEVPVTKMELKSIFDDLARKFGFQQSSKENMYHHLLAQLDSRASRTTSQNALLSLHVSYIGGEQANFRKWFFAAQLDLDEEIGFQNMKLRGKSRQRNFKLAKKRGTSIKEQIEEWQEREQEFISNHPKVVLTPEQLEDKSNLRTADYKWRLKMKQLTPYEMARQLALYLLCWGEANQIRFAPECLCFIFKCALDYDVSTNLSVTETRRSAATAADAPRANAAMKSECDGDGNRNDEAEHDGNKEGDSQRTKDKIKGEDGDGDARENESAPEYTFLQEVIDPLYHFLKTQLYRKNSKGKWVRRENDHKNIIGYDDINQLFWYPEGIERIVLQTGERLVDKRLEDRYLHLKDVEWSRVFYKTYREVRNWMHCLTNFNRFWIIHFAPFWFFTSFNSPTLYTKNYVQLLNNPPTLQARLSAVALGGTISCVIQILATFAEWKFVPREWPGSQHLTKRMCGLLLCLVINVSPSVYVFGFFELDVHSRSAYIISVIQLIVAVITTLFFAVRPLGGLFGSYLNRGRKKRRYVSSQTFTASFPKLSGRSKWFSYGLWTFVFLAKYIESYFFLTLSLRDPIRVLSALNMSRCRGDRLLQRYLCQWQPRVTLGLMILTDLGLFFLDTYLWYIICNCIFSIMLSFSLGTSILSPWKNIYSRLPKRIYSKILATSEMDIKFKPKILISQVWNAIIISMYREHLLSIEHVQRLLYQQVDSMMMDKRTLKSPTFFVAQDDSTFKTANFFPSNSEAKRRISFFAQSLSTPITEPVPVECMPTFTVLVPHYSEKILLSLKEIIKEESSKSKITVLEYLKQLHPLEWDCFVRDTKLLNIEKDTVNRLSKDLLHADSQNNDQCGDTDDNHSATGIHSTGNDERQQQQQQYGNRERENNAAPSLSFLTVDNKEENHEQDLVQKKINDLPYYFFGFSSSEFSYTLRTRIWASLRAQTLYRTISGFMNYSKAIKLLYRVENPSMVQLYGDNVEALENALSNMANRKFRMLVAMQRYTKFNKDEREATELLLKAYPTMCISYLWEEQQDQKQSLGKDPSQNEEEYQDTNKPVNSDASTTGADVSKSSNDKKDNDWNDDKDNEPVFYSCMTNGYADIDEKTGLRKPIFKVRLSGNPILGDGKSDNQNHSLIFYRGEYIQVIDANQDNYLEECLKIRSVLSEFEELDMESTIPYVPGIEYDEEPPPVAIVGAREYIFSENIGVLGDIAAGKEQTFGTLFARTLAEIGGKLHYGHPDFLNAIFMTTRGGLSKAQKGLHLNEDIYAGMTAVCRGGRIKHSDYYQCGKGRDLGFGSILNFTTKIGGGMGEQMLSREYYYLGTQLPIDRFLSFFYAHPGFHLNNMFISLSVQLFFLLLLNLGALNYETILCNYNKDMPITDLEKPIGCYNIQPALHWVSIFVLSIFIVFFIAFAPLVIQELLENGIWRATSRFLHHLLSLAPLFEVFVCQVYSNSLLSDITFGGAKYVSTGRGFAITRIDFAILYSRFANIAIYTGFQVFLMLVFSTVSMWQPALLWFWITVISMCFAPFIFNPHQFSFTDFFIDYRNFIHWLSSGNTQYERESWSSFVKSSRARYTGYKRKTINDVSEQDGKDINKATWDNLFVSELAMPFLVLLFDFSAYMFINAQTGVVDVAATNSVLRLLIVTFIPILFNMVVLLILFFTSLLAGPLTNLCCHNTGSVFAAIAHALSVIVYLVSFELMWFLESWNFARTLILLITCINLHIFIFKWFTVFCLTKEFKNNRSNLAWWTGKWYNTGMGWSVILQPIREFFVKIMESSYFAGDFFLGHFLLYMQTPLLFIPFIEYWHPMLLFWLKPSNIITSKVIYTRKQKRRRSVIVRKYFVLYFLVLGILLVLLVAPFTANRMIPDSSKLLASTPLIGVAQPNGQNNNDTGPNAPTTIMTTTPPMPQFRTVP